VFNLQIFALRPRADDKKPPGFREGAINRRLLSEFYSQGVLKSHTG